MRIVGILNAWVGVSAGLVLVGFAGSIPALGQTPPAPQVKHVAPPDLPTVKPPIERFRELLLLPPAQREAALAGKAPAQIKILRAKLTEYESMTAEERELRLAVTELRWYLVPLLHTAPADRGMLLSSIPAPKRALVEDRLRRWDTLSQNQKKEFLDSEMTVNYLLRLQSGTPEEQANLLHELPAASRLQVEVEWARWRSLPDGQRDRMAHRFQQFFELDAAEKAKALEALSDAERAQMEKSLEVFQTLPANERRHCIRSFTKLANMSPAERDRFLRKAELWATMAPSDREAWRELVQKLPQMPPLPPGLKLGPPLPPTPRLATNQAREN